MLSFNANIPLALNGATAQPIFLLDLEYNAGGSSYTLRLSNRDVIFSTYQYYGIVLSFGNYHQVADLLDFTTSIGSMRITLNNNPGSLKNTRFSDLFSVDNFINRKWTLRLWESHLGTTAATIANGYISSDFEFDDEKFELTLDDYSSIWSKDLPQTIINKTDYVNCPDNNVGKVLPMFYGDADVDSNAPTTTAEFDRHFTNAKVPALITNQWDDTNDYMIAKPDTAALKQLRVKNIFMGKDKYFCPCEDANCSVTVATPQVTLKGNTWRVYVPFLAKSGSSHVTNPANAYDSDFDTYATLSADVGIDATLYLNIPKLPILGTISAIYFIAKCGSFSGTGGEEIGYFVNPANYSFFTWGNAEQHIDMTTQFSATQKSNWTLNDNSYVNFGADTDPCSFRLYECGLEIEFAPSESFIKDYLKRYSPSHFEQQRHGGYKRIKAFYYNQPLHALENVEQVYISGQGRMFGVYIDFDDESQSRVGYSGTNPGYDENDLIENPVYIVEDIFRRELMGSLISSAYGSDNIDIISFDLAGSAASAKGIYVAFDTNMPAFLLSQVDLINSIDLIYNIGYLCNTWFFFSGSGMIKAKTRLNPSDYSTSYSTPDKTIDYNDIYVTKIAKAPLSDVFNDITVNYKKNYLTGNLEASYNLTDATSQGTTVNGYNQILSLNIDGDLINVLNTAYHLCQLKLYCHKDQHNLIEFTITEHPFKYWDLEICDVIKFSNWDSNRKVFGTTPGSNWYSIFDIYKYPDTGLIKIKCFEVS